MIIGMNVRQLREKLKDIPDDMPIYLDDECECMALLSVKEKTVLLWESDDTDEIPIKALVLGIT